MEITKNRIFSFIAILLTAYVAFSVGLRSYFFISGIMKANKLANETAQENSARNYDLFIDFFKKIENSAKNLSKKFSESDLNKLSKNEIFNQLSSALKGKKDFFGFGIGIFKNDKTKIDYYQVNYGKKKKVEQDESLNQDYNFDDQYFGLVSDLTYKKTAILKYYLPIYSDSKIVGIVFAILSNKSFTRFLNTLEPGKLGQTFILYENAPRILDAEQKSKKYAKVLKDSLIKNLFKETYDPFINENVLIISKIVPSFQNDLNQENLKIKRMSFVTSYVKREIVGDYIFELNKSFIFLVGLIVLGILLLSFLFFCLYTWFDPKALGNFSRFITVAFLVAIVIIWRHSYRLDVNFNEEDSGFITSNGSKRLLSLKNVAHDDFVNYLSQLKTDSYSHTLKWEKFEPAEGKNKIIPIGILVRSIDFVSSFYIQVNAYIWGIFPKEFSKKFKDKFFFPDSIFTREFSIVYREDLSKDKEVIGWNYVGQMVQDFDYLKYPIDHKQIKIKICPKAIDEMIIVPNYKNYNSFNPLQLPGLIDGFGITGYRVDSSYFSYDKIGYNSTLGLDEIEDQTNYELTLNIKMRGDVFDPFLTALLPLLVALYLLFIALLFTDPEKTLAAVSALFFVILYAHIALRQKIGVSIVFYLEYFYIVAYIMMLLVVVSQVLLSSKYEVKWLRWQDGLITKVLFWPLFLMISLIITIFTFCC